MWAMIRNFKYFDPENPSDYFTTQWFKEDGIYLNNFDDETWEFIEDGTVSEDPTVRDIQAKDINGYIIDRTDDSIDNHIGEKLYRIAQAELDWFENYASNHGRNGKLIIVTYHHCFYESDLFRVEED